MTRWLKTVLIIATLSVLVPAAAQAQSSIAGQVKDTSGGVLPGVTVEASSPVLIEQTRSAVTDSQGQYNIIDLRPGTYTVVYLTVPHAAARALKAEANTVVPINVELPSGPREAITVSGSSRWSIHAAHSGPRC